MSTTSTSFDGSRYGGEPYILWVDQDSFKARTASIQSSLEMCEYQKLWKFKTVDRMRIFLKGSLASDYIRSGTKFVLVVSNHDCKSAMHALVTSDVSAMLGMVVVIPEGDNGSSFESTCMWVEESRKKIPIYSKIVVATNWLNALSALIIWRRSQDLGTRKSQTDFISNSTSESANDLSCGYYSLLSPPS